MYTHYTKIDGKEYFDGQKPHYKTVIVSTTKDMHTIEHFEDLLDGAGIKYALLEVATQTGLKREFQGWMLVSEQLLYKKLPKGVGIC